MTNSEVKQPKQITGTEDLISHEEGKYVSDKGTPFKIELLPNGLYRILMLKGGKTPRICDGLYTGYNLAQQALVKYLRENNRLGDAVFPKRIGR